MLLEGLGDSHEVFERYQDDAVQTIRKAANSLKEAASLLECHGLGVSLLSIYFSPSRQIEPKQPSGRWLCNLRDLKNHSRIPVPVAWTLVGIADTHQFLQENQIFVCIKPIGGGGRFLGGRVPISRSATIHPGDVRIVEIIGLPPPGSCFDWPILSCSTYKVCVSSFSCALSSIFDFW